MSASHELLTYQLLIVKVQYMNVSLTGFHMNHVSNGEGLWYGARPITIGIGYPRHRHCDHTHCLTLLGGGGGGGGGGGEIMAA